MAMWRESHQRDKQSIAYQAMFTRAAVAAAIINTIAGQEAGAFDDLIGQLMGDEGREEREHSAPDWLKLPAGMFIPKATLKQGEFTPI